MFPVTVAFVETLLLSLLFSSSLFIRRWMLGEYYCEISQLNQKNSDEKNEEKEFLTLLNIRKNIM